MRGNGASMMASPPSFDFYPGDFLKSTSHMTAAEVGCFLRLLCHQWEHGQLPSDLHRKAIVAGCDKDQFASYWVTLADKFQGCRDGGQRYNERMETDRKVALETWQKRRKAAKKARTHAKSAYENRQKLNELGSLYTVLLTEEGSRKGEESDKEGDARGRKRPQVTADIQQVVEHYQTHHPRSRPGAKERQKISQRLGEGHTVTDLQAAIDGCHKSAWHCGQNDSGTRYQSLELIMRDAAHVQQFLEVNDTPSNGKPDEVDWDNLVTGSSDDTA